MTTVPKAESGERELSSGRRQSAAHAPYATSTAATLLRGSTAERLSPTSPRKTEQTPSCSAHTLSCTASLPARP